MPRFPNTAAAIEHEMEGFVEALFDHPIFQRKLGDMGRPPADPSNTEGLDMATINELKEALAANKASIDALTAKVGAGNTGIEPSDLDPILAEIREMGSTVEALSKSLDKPDPSTAGGPQTGATAA